MPVGMEVYGPDGTTVYVNMTMSISQQQGETTTGAKNGSITMPTLPSGKTRWYIIVPIVDTKGWKGKKPGVLISGNTLSWSYSHSTWFGQFSANCRIVYGYY